MAEAGDGVRHKKVNKAADTCHPKPAVPSKKKRGDQTTQKGWSMCQFQLGPEYTIKYMPIQVLSMRGKDGVGTVAELMSGIWSLLPEREEASKYDMLFRDDNEGQGMEFMKEDTGAVMQLLHLKALGALLLNTATTIHHSPEVVNFKLKLYAPS